MLRMFFVFITGIFILGAISIYGCKSLEKPAKEIREDFKLDSDPVYPQGLEKEIEEHGEP